MVAQRRPIPLPDYNPVSLRPMPNIYSSHSQNHYTANVSATLWLTLIYAIFQLHNKPVLLVDCPVDHEGAQQLIEALLVSDRRQ